MTVPCWVTAGWHQAPLATTSRAVMNTRQWPKKGHKLWHPAFKRKKSHRWATLVWGRGGRGKAGFPLPKSQCSWHFASLTHRCFPNTSHGYTEDSESKLTLTHRHCELFHHGEKVSLRPHIHNYICVFIHKLWPSSIRAPPNKSEPKCLIKKQLSIIKMYFLLVSL